MKKAQLKHSKPVLNQRVLNSTQIKVLNFTNAKVAELEVKDCMKFLEFEMCKTLV
jgi:hypothetical protein